MNHLVINQVGPEHKENLSGLTKRSKAFWGYSPELMSLWDEELTLKSDYFEQHIVFAAWQADHILGYYSYYQTGPSAVHMDNLFIDPTVIRKKIGTILMQHFLNRITSHTIQKITLHADPHSEAFYTHFGFQVIGQYPSSVPNRALPIMELIL